MPDDRVCRVERAAIDADRSAAPFVEAVLAAHLAGRHDQAQHTGSDR
jgi:uncharacterized MAPEG superfamily protein